MTAPPWHNQSLMAMFKKMAQVIQTTGADIAAFQEPAAACLCRFCARVGASSAKGGRQLADARSTHTQLANSGRRGAIRQGGCARPLSLAAIGRARHFTDNVTSTLAQCLGP